jgi:hypothetical protein
MLPTITKDHKLTGVTPIAKPIELIGIPPVAKINRAHTHPTCSQTNRAHRHPTCSQTKNHAHRLHTCCIPWIKPTRLKPADPTTPYPTNRVKGLCRSWPWDSYHASLHSAEVAQLYPQVSDSITHRWLRVSISPNVHFLSCTTRRSPQSLSHRFLACKIFTLRFHHCGSHILQRPPLAPRLGGKLTLFPKSRKPHLILLPWISAKLRKQHVTQLSLPISALCFALFIWLHVPWTGP